MASTASQAQGPSLWWLQDSYPYAVLVELDYMHPMGMRKPYLHRTCRSATAALNRAS